MMKISRLEKYENFEENIIKKVGNLFRLKKLKTEINDPPIKGIKIFFKRKKETKAIKDIIVRGIRNLFEHKEEDYYNPVRVANFWNKNYIDYKSKGDRTTLSVKKYLNKVRSHLKDIINNLEISDTWKTWLTITINFVSSIDDNDEKHVMHSKSDNIEIIINNEADEVKEESLLDKY